MISKPITVNELRHHFHYHPHGYLIRKIKTAPNTWVGQRVSGHSRGETKGGYLYIFFKKNGVRRRIAFHKAVFAIVRGRFPTLRLDHKDRNPKNNCIGNLRESTISQNSFNTKLDRRNKSGYRGIIWSKNRKVWRVILGANKKYHFFGNFRSKEAAIKAQKKAVRRLHGKFKSNN